MVRIFYVEDEPFLAKIVKESLETRGYNVTLVQDGGNAQDVFAKEHFDICILDIMLPNKSGYEIAENIRKIDHKTPILFLSAKDQTTDVIEGFKKGGNEYVRKPFSMEELIVRIENLLSMSNNTSENRLENQAFQIGQNIVFRPENMNLKCKEEHITLSHRENSILKILCSAISDAVERKTILLNVWGDDSISNSRNLDVYIRKLRSYLKEDENLKIITLKGVGYHFVVE